MPSEALPALVMVDGSETVDALETGVLSIQTRFSVVLYAGAATEAGVGTALNALRASVIDAFWADTTLGGVVGRVDYEGCDDPELAPESESVGSLELFFVLERGEAELDPYTAA